VIVSLVKFSAVQYTEENGQICTTCCSERFLQFHMERVVISGFAVGMVGCPVHSSKFLCSKFKFTY